MPGLDEYLWPEEIYAFEAEDKQMLEFVALPVSLQENIPIKKQTSSQLLEELAFWKEKIENATSWGAALTATDEICRDIERELHLRNTQTR